jgi:hypothetical protein
MALAGEVNAFHLILLWVTWFPVMGGRPFAAFMEEGDVRERMC